MDKPFFFLKKSIKMGKYSLAAKWVHLPTRYKGDEHLFKMSKNQ